jgi:hypothetical protein
MKNNLQKSKITLRVIIQKNVFLYTIQIRNLFIFIVLFLTLMFILLYYLNLETTIDSVNNLLDTKDCLYIPKASKDSNRNFLYNLTNIIYNKSNIYIKSNFIQNNFANSINENYEFINHNCDINMRIMSLHYKVSIVTYNTEEYLRKLQELNDNFFSYLD